MLVTVNIQEQSAFFQVFDGNDGSHGNPGLWERGNCTPVSCASKIVSAQCKVDATILLLYTEGKISFFFYSQSTVALETKPDFFKEGRKCLDRALDLALKSLFTTVLVLFFFLICCLLNIRVLQQSKKLSLIPMSKACKLLYVEMMIE